MELITAIHTRYLAALMTHNLAKCLKYESMKSSKVNVFMFGV